MSYPETVLERVRKSLGRTAPLATPPVPPAIPDPITRLVHSDIGLPELFIKRAKEQKMLVSQVYVEELLASLVDFLTSKGVKRIAMSESAFLTKLNVKQALIIAGFEVRSWSELSVDDCYDVDASVTDVWRAVAESGSLVIRASKDQGRILSLTPFIHCTILEPKNFLPDLVDLFELMQKEGAGSATVLISGPSKTADIEMNVVTGVHGPNIVHAFVLK